MDSTFRCIQLWRPFGAFCHVLANRSGSAVSLCLQQAHQLITRLQGSQAPINTSLLTLIISVLFHTSIMEHLPWSVNQHHITSVALALAAWLGHSINITSRPQLVSFGRHLPNVHSLWALAASCPMPAACQLWLPVARCPQLVGFGSQLPNAHSFFCFSCQLPNVQ